MFEVLKTGQIICLILEDFGGEMTYLQLMKILYMVDREGFNTLGYGPTWGHYFSMENGPVLSEAKDELCKFSKRDSFWAQNISPIIGNKISLKNSPFEKGELSEAELELVSRVCHLARTIGLENLVDYCHENFPEWSHPGIGKMTPIEIDSIFDALKKGEKEKQYFLERKALRDFHQEIFFHL